MSPRLSLLRMSLNHLATPNNYLRVPAVSVREAGVDWDDVVNVASELLRLMYAQPGGVGLAANMAGIGLRIMVMDAGEEPIVLIDPRIDSVDSNTTTMQEANLCLPGWFGEVERPKSVTIAASTLLGRQQTFRFRDWEARIVLHEISLLDGQMFTDLVPSGQLRDVRVATLQRNAIDAAVSRSTEGLEEGSPMHYFNAVTLTPCLLPLRETVLRRKAQPLDFNTWESGQLNEVVSEMFWLQHHLEGVGLAAPQIGFSVQLAVIDNQRDAPLVLINPEILEFSEEVDTANEGCLSLPGFSGPVSRSKTVRVKYDSIDGQPVELEASGFLARIVQHEVDHLNGLLYADKLVEGGHLRAVDADTLAQKAISSLLDDGKVTE